MSIFKLMDWVFPLRLYQSNVAAAVIGGAVVGGAVNAYSANTASNAQQSAASTAENTILRWVNCRTGPRREGNSRIHSMQMI